MSGVDLDPAELPQPTKAGYAFSGWSLDGVHLLPDPVQFDTNQKLTALWEEDSHQRVVIHYEVNGGIPKIAEKRLVKGSFFVAPKPSPTRAGYTFQGWFTLADGGTNLERTKVTQNIKAYAQWEPVSSSSSTQSSYSGGGGMVSRPSQSNTNDINQKNTVDMQQAHVEQENAYQRAYRNGITTLYPQSEARLFEPITRAELAKMMSVYSRKFLDKPQLTGKVGCADFTDKGEVNEELAGFMQTACELEIMGLHSDGKTPLSAFRPNDIVPRAEFATVFSRLKRGNLYDNNQQEGR